MEYKRILSGSSEFFPDNAKDKDYIVFKEQEETFSYSGKSDGVCEFCYKPLSKQAYFKWHEEENNWSLNFAPLITRSFLEFMNIDIFNADKEQVFNIIKKAFLGRFCFANSEGKFSKHLYRFYIYWRFIDNGNFKLSSKELDYALNLKKQRGYNKQLMLDMFNFYECEEYEIKTNFAKVTFEDKETVLTEIKEKNISAFRLFQNDVLFGVETITGEEQQALIDWYKRCIDLEEDAVLNVPERIKKYL